jgi:hypothetical protein
MKYILVIITASLIALSFTGCSTFTKSLMEAAEETTEKSENSKASDTTENPAKQTCTVGDVSFEVPAEWDAVNGLDGSFTSPDKKTAYQLQGESILGSYTPDEFFHELINSYSSSYKIVRKEKGVSPLTTADGTECFAGRIEMTENNVLFSIDVLIAPSKNTVLTFASQCKENRKPYSDIRDVTKTTVFNIGTEDMASGRKFKVSIGTEIHLNDDGSFKYFKESGDPNGSYFQGSYEVYYGQAAFDKLVSMKEYGLTEEELESTLSANMNGYSIGGSSPMDYFNNGEASDNEGYHICRDTFYTIIMHTNVLVEDGQASDMDGTAIYMGYYLPEIEQFDLLSINTVTYTQWTEIK